MQTDLTEKQKREIALFQTLTIEEKTDLLTKAELLVQGEEYSEENLDQLIENNILHLTNTPIEVKEQTPTPPAIIVSNTPPPEKTNDRYVMTVGFTGESKEVVQSIVEHHIAMGWAENKSDFLAKAIDFAVNLYTVTGKQYFGVPDNHVYKLLKNGFTDFTTTNKNIPICK